MNNMIKKCLSLLLSLTMIFSFLAVPAGAVVAPTVTLSVVSFTEAQKSIPVEGAAVTSAKTGDKVAVKVLFTNTTDTKMFFSGYSIRIKYDTNVFDSYTYSYSDSDNGEISVGPVAFAGAAAGVPTSWKSFVGKVQNGSAQWANTGTTYKAIDAGGTAVLGYLLL